MTRSGGGELQSFCARGESRSTIPIPQSIIIKTLTSTRGGKRGREKKKSAGRRRDRDRRQGRLKRAEHKRVKRGKKEGAGIPHWTE